MGVGGRDRGGDLAAEIGGHRRVRRGRGAGDRHAWSGRAGRVMRGDVGSRQGERIDRHLIQVAGERARRPAWARADCEGAWHRLKPRGGRLRSELHAVHEEAHGRSVVGRRDQAPDMQWQAGRERDCSLDAVRPALEAESRGRQPKTRALACARARLAGVDVARCCVGRARAHPRLDRVRRDACRAGCAGHGDRVGHAVEGRCRVGFALECAVGDAGMGTARVDPRCAADEVGGGRACIGPELPEIGGAVDLHQARVPVAAPPGIGNRDRRAATDGRRGGRRERDSEVGRRKRDRLGHPGRQQPRGGEEHDDRGVAGRNADASALDAARRHGALVLVGPQGRENPPIGAPAYARRTTSTEVP